MSINLYWLYFNNIFCFSSGSKQYEVYYCDTTNQKFLNFHERLQTFILFYIDAASFIDVDDPKWQFFVV